MDTELMTQTTCPMDMLEEHQMEAADVLGLCKKKWKYMAMDADGKWYLFTEKPHLIEGIWVLNDPSFDNTAEATKIVNIKPAENWKTSLLEALG